MPEPLLTVRGLTKRYAVTVLDQASLEVRAGEIHGLLGANGAGKSTLCRIIAGLLTPTAGQMTFNRRAYEPANKQDAESLGIQMVQQELNLIPSLSVAENIMLGRTPHRFGVIRQRGLASSGTPSPRSIRTPCCCYRHDREHTGCRTSANGRDRFRVRSRLQLADLG